MAQYDLYFCSVLLYLLLLINKFTYIIVAKILVPSHAKYFTFVSKRDVTQLFILHSISIIRTFHYSVPFSAEIELKETYGEIRASERIY